MFKHRQVLHLRRTAPAPFRHVREFITRPLARRFCRFSGSFGRWRPSSQETSAQRRPRYLSNPYNRGAVQIELTRAFVLVEYGRVADHLQNSRRRIHHFRAFLHGPGVPPVGFESGSTLSILPRKYVTAILLDADWLTIQYKPGYQARVKVTVTLHVWGSWRVKQLSTWLFRVSGYSLRHRQQLQGTVHRIVLSCSRCRPCLLTSGLCR